MPWYATLLLHIVLHLYSVDDIKSFKNDHNQENVKKAFIKTWVSGAS